jgi:hypothetical protein
LKEKREEKRPLLVDTSGNEGTQVDASGHDIESLALFDCFRGLKQPLFGVFRGLILLKAFLEFSGALN